MASNLLMKLKPAACARLLNAAHLPGRRLRLMHTASGICATSSIAKGSAFVLLPVQTPAQAQSLANILWHREDGDMRRGAFQSGAVLGLGDWDNELDLTPTPVQLVAGCGHFVQLRLNQRHHPGRVCGVVFQAIDQF
jgi:hypothetical protein